MVRWRAPTLATEVPGIIAVYRSRACQSPKGGLDCKRAAPQAAPTVFSGHNHAKAGVSLYLRHQLSRLNPINLSNKKRHRLAEVVVQHASIVAIVRELIPAGVPEHV